MATVEQFLTTQTHLSPATQARQQAALNSFFTWAVRHDLLLTNPMIKIERVRLDDPAPRGLRREQIEAIFAVIPGQQLRDRLLFRLIYETAHRSLI
jgi:site-specific recombinase XerD